MATYHNNLKYHEDKIEKHNITRNEIEFLMKLQKEMNTQDTVSQADPRFWVIKGSVKEYGIEDGYEDGTDIIDEVDRNVVAQNLEEFTIFINDCILDDINVEYDRNYEIEYNKNADTVSIHHNEEPDEETEYDLDEFIKWVNSFGYTFDTVNYIIRDKIYPNTMFLTQKEAENHLKQNYYHYSEDAHTYAMTAWRSPDVEKLYMILHSVDFEKLL